MGCACASELNKSRVTATAPKSLLFLDCMFAFLTRRIMGAVEINKLQLQKYVEPKL
jgi:hypothetical protein